MWRLVKLNEYEYVYMCVYRRSKNIVNKTPTVFVQVHITWEIIQKEQDFGNSNIIIKNKMDPQFCTSSTKCNWSNHKLSILDFINNHGIRKVMLQPVNNIDHLYHSGQLQTIRKKEKI